MYDIICPHCGAELEIDGCMVEYLDSTNHTTYECDKCEKEITLYAEFEPIWYVEKDGELS